MFNLGDGKDTVSDSNGMDTVVFNEEYSDLVFAKEGNNLIIENMGFDKVTIDSWFNRDTYQTEVFQTNESMQLLNTQVNQLIQAMADLSEDTGLSWGEMTQNKNTDALNLLQEYWTHDEAI